MWPGPRTSKSVMPKAYTSVAVETLAPDSSSGAFQPANPSPHPLSASRAACIAAEQPFYAGPIVCSRKTIGPFCIRPISLSYARPIGLLANRP